MNPHFKKLRESLAKDLENSQPFKRREDAEVDYEGSITDPYSSLADSDFCVTDADPDINDATWGKMIRREPTKSKRGYK